MSKSLIDYAYEFVSKHKTSVNFKDIWEYVKKEAGLSEEEANKKVGQFFTNMMLDGRFITLGENEWDLRERHVFDKVHIDMRDVYSDVQTSDIDVEDEEEVEYNKVFEEDTAIDASAEEGEDKEESSEDDED